MNTLKKYNPNNYRTLSFNSFLNEFFNKELAMGGTQRSFTPKVDIIEEEEIFLLQLHAPGLSKADFKVDLEDNHLTISGERELEKEKKAQNFRSVESSYGSFVRSFELPNNIVKEKVEASYKDGILNISIPKDTKKIASKHITVG